MAESFDLIIIGTGSVGASAGYYAAKKGLKVLEIDAYEPPHSEGSHHGQTRIIRHAYGEGPVYVPLVLRAQELWDELATNTGADIFHQTGVLNIAPKNSSFLANIRQSSETYNLPIKVYNAKDAHEKWQGINLPDHFQAVLEQKSGYLNSEVAIQTYIDEAKKIGVRTQFNTVVTKIEEVQNGQVIVTTNQGIYQGKNAVVSVGTWVKNLVPNLPIKPIRKVVSWFESPDIFEEKNGFPAFTIQLDNGTHYYGFPSNNGLIKIGRHQGGQKISSAAERLSFGTLAEDTTEIDPLFKNVLKNIGKLDHGVSCSYDLSPDENFIIDYLPDKKHIQIVTGLSGHGFKFASVLGEIIVNKVIGNEVKFDLSPFLLSRFD